jgi:hypothetical protein
VRLARSHFRARVRAFNPEPPGAPAPARAEKWSTVALPLKNIGRRSARVTPANSATIFSLGEFLRRFEIDTFGWISNFGRCVHRERRCDFTKLLIKKSFTN